MVKSNAFTGGAIAGLTSTENIVMAAGKGIDFSAATPDGTGALGGEVLSDYEQGTFSATLLGSGGNPTVAFSNLSCQYTKIGRTVHVDIKAYTSSVSGGSGNLSIGGLPFTRTGSGATAVTPGFIYALNTPIVGGVVDAAATSITCYSSFTANTQSQVSHLVAGTNYIQMSCTYTSD